MYGTLYKNDRVFMHQFITRVCSFIQQIKILDFAIDSPDGAHLALRVTVY